MASQTFTIRSTLDQQAAFDRLVDLTRVNEWDRGVSDPRQLTGDGHVQGSTYEVTVTGFDGEPTPVVYELQDVDAPNGFAMQGETEVFRAHDSLTFESADSGCVLTYVGTLVLLEDEPPLAEAELDSLFVHIAGIAEQGLKDFLNP